MTTTSSSSFSWIKSAILRQACLDALVKLDPRALWKNPVMFVTAVGAVLSSFVLVRDGLGGHPSAFVLQITLWLWFTVLFANFRGGDGGRTRQGAGRLLARFPLTDLWRAGSIKRGNRASPHRSSSPATWSFARPTTSMPGDGDGGGRHRQRR